MEVLRNGFDFLGAQTGSSLLYIFWYALIFELPRYSLTLGSAALGALANRAMLGPSQTDCYEQVRRDTLSVLIVGHNEADKIERCVRSLQEQTCVPDEIVIVSDGSSDKMAKVAARLVREGHATRVLSTNKRGGKSGGTNLAVRFTSCDLIAVVDCDCSFDRYAIEGLVAPLSDTSIGGTCGDIVPRNGDASLISGFQEIEYLLTISMSKRIGNALDQVICLSGAFGAFRRSALESVGFFDVGGGEDLDATMRLRDHGWRVVFAENAVCYTDVPTSFWALARQRLRWERDSIWVRYRKHWRAMSPFHARFQLREALHQWDFLLFGVLAAVIFPIYTFWLFETYGSFAFSVLIAIQIIMTAVDLLTMALAALVTGRTDALRLVFLIPGFSFFNGYIMKNIRLLAYFQEIFFSSSREDNYIPARVRSVRSW